MDREQVTRWLDADVAAWRSNDRPQIEALFTPDATYRCRPYDDTLVAAAAIADDWLKDPDDPAVWEAADARFADDGRSRDFTVVHARSSGLSSWPRRR